MFRTPNLQQFRVTWFLQPSQFQDMGEDFIAHRFIEDIMDGRRSISLVVEGVEIPDLTGHIVGQEVPVVLRIVATQNVARELIELGYKVRDRDEPDEDDGTTWSEFMSLFNHAVRNKDHERYWDKPMRLTDDNDPNAPWFKVMGIKFDDDGPLLAIEEIEV
jgi:hypothetical protein